MHLAVRRTHPSGPSAPPGPSPALLAYLLGPVLAYRQRTGQRFTGVLTAEATDIGQAARLARKARDARHFAELPLRKECHLGAVAQAPAGEGKAGSSFL